VARSVGTIGETKLKILAVIHRNELEGKISYGYNIWTTLKNEFYCYLDRKNLRNVYRHLKDLNKFGLVERGESQSVEKAPRRQLYYLTKDGKQLKQKFNKYLEILETSG
jgi:DNA-binding PadR family transcriptional regulator